RIACSNADSVLINNHAFSAGDVGGVQIRGARFQGDKTKLSFYGVVDQRSPVVRRSIAIPMPLVGRFYYIQSKIGRPIIRIVEVLIGALGAWVDANSGIAVAHL